MHEDCKEEIKDLQKRISKAEEFERKHLELHTKLTEMIELQKKQIAPISEVFANANGFMKFTIWIVKFLVVISTGFGIIYGVIKYLKD